MITDLDVADNIDVDKRDHLNIYYLVSRLEQSDFIIAPKKRDRSKSNRIMVPKKRSESEKSKLNRIRRERRAAIKNNEAKLTVGEIKTLEKNRVRSALYNEKQRRKREKDKKDKKREQKKRKALNKKLLSSEETLVSKQVAAAGVVASRERKIALSLRSCNDKTHPSTSIELTRCLDSLCILQNQDPTVNPIFLDVLVVHVAVVAMMIFGRMISEDALTESSVPLAKPILSSREIFLPATLTPTSGFPEPEPELVMTKQMKLQRKMLLIPP